MYNNVYDYKLYETTIQNSGVISQVEFYFREPRKYLSRTEALAKIREEDKGSFTHEHAKKYIDLMGGIHKFANMVLLILKQFIKHYGGFPSAGEPVERIYIALLPNSAGSFQRKSSKECIVTLGISECDSSGGFRECARVIYHEVLHFISLIHHNEAELFREVKKRMQKYDKKIKFDNAEFQIRYSALMQALANVSLKDTKITEKQILFWNKEIMNLFKEFMLFFVEKFHNVISDMALEIIQIEMGICVEYSFRMERAKVKFHVAETDNSYLINLGRYIKNSNMDFIEILGFKKEEMLNIIKLMMYVNFIRYYPFFVLPYAKLGKKWVHGKPIVPDPAALKLLNDYKAFVNKSVVPELKNSLNRSFEAFDAIVDYHKIRNDPYDKNIKRQIHDTGSIKLSKKAYGIIMNEMHKYYKKHAI